MEMVVSNRGASQAVAWVLLLGLSISLALLVGTWLRNATQETGENLVNNAEQNQRCADTRLSLIEKNCTSSTVRFFNTGLFSITKVKCNGQDVFLSSGNNTLLPGKESIPINSCITATINTSSVVPFTLLEGKEIACAGNTLSIRC